MSGAGFAERLARLRAREQLTVEQFADRFALPPEKIEQLEAGQPPCAAMRLVTASIEMDPASIAAAAWWAGEDGDL